MAVAPKVSIKVSGDAQLERAFNLMSSRIEDWRPIWPDIGVIWYIASAAYYSTEGLGAWPQLSDGYKRWKEKHHPGRQILVLTGDLKASVTSKTAAGAVYRAGAKQLSIGTSIWYAKYHQQKGRKGRIIPKRAPVIEKLDQSYLNSMARIAVNRFGAYAESLGFKTKKG
jgi:phage gpG-like protein